MTIFYEKNNFIFVLLKKIYSLFIRTNNFSYHFMNFKLKIKFKEFDFFFQFLGIKMIFKFFCLHGYFSLLGIIHGLFKWQFSNFRKRINVWELKTQKLKQIKYHLIITVFLVYKYVITKWNLNHFFLYKNNRIILMRRFEKIDSKVSYFSDIFHFF